MTLGLLAALWLAWIVVGVCSEMKARHRLRAIPHRVLVAGGRGKTTLVRLIHSGLAASDIDAVARVSGDRPLSIAPDGTEHPQRRWGPANIREIRRLFRRIPNSSVEAVVVENMAIDPEMQSIVAHRMVRPTLAVMAPDALDHLEVVPADQSERVRLHLAALPLGSKVIFPDGESGQAYLQCAPEFGFEWSVGSRCDHASLRPFMKVLAGTALEAVGEVAGQVSSSARDAVVATAGRLQNIRVFTRNDVAWVDGLSANDPAAAQQLAATAFQEARNKGFSVEGRLFNHRADRPSRLPLFAGLLEHGGPAWIVGSEFPPAWSSRFEAPKLSGSPGEIVEAIENELDGLPGRAYVLCLGNTSGTGQALRQWLQSNGEVEAW